MIKFNGELNKCLAESVFLSLQSLLFLEWPLNVSMRLKAPRYWPRTMAWFMGRMLWRINRNKHVIFSIFYACVYCHSGHWEMLNSNDDVASLNKRYSGLAGAPFHLSEHQLVENGTFLLM